MHEIISQAVREVVSVFGNLETCSPPSLSLSLSLSACVCVCVWLSSGISSVARLVLRRRIILRLIFASAPLRIKRIRLALISTIRVLAVYCPGVRARAQRVRLRFETLLSKAAAAPEDKRDDVRITGDKQTRRCSVC